VFVGEKGGLLRRSNWHVLWDKARAQVGLPDFRLHDLRHTCNTLTAATGASTRELMYRMGHASASAALRYQHATRERDEVIARALDRIVLDGSSANRDIV
jgi:integrase